MKIVPRKRRPRVKESPDPTPPPSEAEFRRLAAGRTLALMRAGEPYPVGELMSDGNIRPLPWFIEANNLVAKAKREVRK